jgi:hypothetical protein
MWIYTLDRALAQTGENSGSKNSRDSQDVYQDAYLTNLCMPYKWWPGITQEWPHRQDPKHVYESKFHK